MSLSNLNLGIISAISLGLLATNGFAADSNPILQTPLAELQWETTAEGVGFAPLEGNRFQEAYMAMVRLPAGLISPAHVKTANMFGLVVSGTISNVALGADASSEIHLSAGAWYKIPAGLAHISKCVSDVNCVTFLYQDGKFDFLPVEP